MQVLFLWTIIAYTNIMYIAILGRQPKLGIAELERVYSSPAVDWFSDHTATVDTPYVELELLGGSLKTGRIVERFSGDWREASTKIVQTYSKAWSTIDHKVTLGISAYGFSASPRDIQKTGLILKSKLRSQNVSLRLIPNSDSALNTATSHHNKLGLSPNKVELLVVRGRGNKIILAESIGAQNITALAARDRQRPKRDARVGMLPPKLAQIITNLATPRSSHEVIATQGHLQPECNKAPGPSLVPGAQPSSIGYSRNGDAKSVASRSERSVDEKATKNKIPVLLDPFCGTGVILQEAALMGYSVYGTDLAEKMVEYSRTNLEWLAAVRHINIDATLYPGDATSVTWQPPIDAVATETYLGQPFSAPPSPAKLREVQRNCDHIITEFLKNLAPQIKSGTPLCLAIPAWRDQTGRFTHLPLIKQLEKLGYIHYQFKNIHESDLLYYREEQIVARELLVLTKR